MKVSKSAVGGASRAIAGYELGSARIPRAPIDLQELESIKQAMGWTARDEAALRQAAPLLEPRINEILDAWYGFIGSTPQLIAAFSAPATGTPDQAYMERVRARFGQWIRDTLALRQDQEWLDYQFEIGRRHHRTGKNMTDEVEAAPIVPMRYLLALLAPVVNTLRPFFEGKAAPAEVDRMLEAWHKAVLLQVIVWTYPYVQPEDF